MANPAFESQLKALRRKLDSATASRKKQVVALRAKAAEAALNWVISHEDRVNQFRSAVKGTPVAGAVDKLLTLLKSEAKSAKAPAKKTAKKKAPARKKAAKKSTKKAAKKTTRKATRKS